MKKLKEKFQRLSPKNRLFELDIPLIGLTGGISTGKSTAANFFNKQGFPTVCADTLVKKIYSQSSSVSFIKTLSKDAITKKNQIDFKILRKLFFSSNDIKTKVESFIYAQIPRSFIEEFKKLNSPNFVIYDVPLLFEKELESKFDLTLCIYTTKMLQIERLVNRDKIETSLAEKIIQSQMDIEKKKKLADFFIDNSKGKNELKEGLNIFLKNVFE